VRPGRAERAIVGVVAVVAVATAPSCVSAAHARVERRPTTTTSLPIPGPTTSTAAPVPSTAPRRATATFVQPRPLEPPLAIVYQGPTAAEQGHTQVIDVGGRAAYVWLPAEYRQSPARSARFPVVFLLHGSPASYREWPATDWADVQADALLAAGRIRPAIIVSPEPYLPPPPVNPNCDSRSEQYLVDQLVPAVDAQFRTNGQRAIGGLSDGGGCAIVWAGRHPDVFQAAFSLDGYFPTMPPPATGLHAFLQVGSGDSAESRAESAQAATILGVPLDVTPGVSHSRAAWSQELGFALPFAIGWLADPWPLRRTTPTDRIVLGAPPPLPDGYPRVGTAPTRLSPVDQLP